MSVSQQKSIENNKILAKENKAYLEQLEQNKKNIKENNDKFFDKKKQYKCITKNKKKIKKTKIRGAF